MKNTRKYFNEEQLHLLESIGIRLDNDTDYSDDDIADMYDKVTEIYQDTFSKDGEPQAETFEWEPIVDIFTTDLDK